MRKKRKGATLVTILIVAFCVSVMLYGMHLIFKNNDSSIVNDSESKELFYAVKSGIEIGEQALNANETDYLVKDKDGNMVKIRQAKMVHDFQQNILTGSLEDVIDNSDLPGLSSNVKIKIKIDKIGSVEATNYINEQIAAGVDSKDIINRENMFRIKSIATNSKSGRTSEMTKIIDTNTLNTIYE